jgi:hypothetical protein
MAKAKDTNREQARHQQTRSTKNMTPSDEALDIVLEATFPASDPPAIPWTRIGKPYHPM